MALRGCQWASLVIASVLALEVHAADDIVRLPLGKVGTLSVPTPTGAKRIQPPRSSGAMLSFESAQRSRMQLLLTPIPLESGFMADAEVREMVERGAARARPQAVETAFPFTPLKGDQARGYYFRATDRAPGPDEYKYLYQGAVLVGASVVTFTVLYNDDGKHEAEAALDVVRKMQLRAAGGI
jgi:hypothetical protein